MNKKKNILIIGLGGFGKNHLRVLNHFNKEKYNIYASDMNENLLKLCDEYEMPKNHVSKNFMDFFDIIDAVDIVTGTDSHYNLCKLFLEAGKDVFVEKPLTMNSNEGERLIKIQNKNNCIFQVGHMHRYNPAINFVKEEIANGNMGKVLYIYGHFMGFKRMRSDVGVTHTDSIHYYDICDYLIDEEAISVQGVMKDTMGRGMDDISISFINYPDTLVQIESGYFAPGKWRDITIIGSKQTIVVDIVKQSAEIYFNYFEKKDDLIIPHENGSKTHPIATVEPLKLELSEFLNSLDSRKKPIADASVGLKMIKIYEAVKKSAEQKKEIFLTN
jgi:predicted dehydrogenase